MDNFIGYPAKLNDCVLSLNQEIGDHVILNCKFNVPQDIVTVVNNIGDVLRYMEKDYTIIEIETLDKELVYDCKLVLKFY
jgi:hypothetical protein